MPASSKIAIHHVGGRWGNRSFPILPRFESDFVVVFYEADTEAIAGIHEACAGQAAELIVFPYCLGTARAEADLHVYSNPGLTSLRRLGTTLQKRYLHLFGVDFDFDGDGARLVEQRRIQLHPLDGILTASQTACPAPDFLSLDVQGCEHEVLLGAEATLRDSVCGLIVEVEFAEMYAGQKRFQEICDLLAGHGFDFVRFQSVGEAAGPIAPLGFRLGGYHSWADALFLRRPSTLLHGRAAAGKLRKLCFMAVVFGNIELALECLECLRSVEVQHTFDDAVLLVYETFVAELADIYDRTEKIHPPLFSAVLPRHRVADYARASGVEQWPAIFEGLRTFDEAYRRQIDALQATGDTEFEALLRRYDFNDHADRVNFMRRHQAIAVGQAIDTARGGLSNDR